MKALLAALLALVATALSAQTVQINGAGATFPYPIYSKWFDEYHKAHPNAEINYQSIGSGGGIRQLTNGTVFFGASDGPMTNDQILAAGFPILHLPPVLPCRPHPRRRCAGRPAPRSPRSSRPCGSSVSRMRTRDRSAGRSGRKSPRSFGGLPRDPRPGWVRSAMRAAQSRRVRRGSDSPSRPARTRALRRRRAA